MIRFRAAAPMLFMLCLLNVAGCATTSYHPEYNQPGKDVVWWPTSQALVDKMLDLAKVTPEDFVIDLGSGDGRTVITAAKRGARALGIEYNPELVELSKHNAGEERVAERTQFVQADLFQVDFSQATVLTLFLSEAINLGLRPRILSLKAGTRVVSNTFPMGEWTPDVAVTLRDSEGCTRYCTALLWVVPANVEGVWKLSEGELTLTQKFQMFSGTYRTGSNSVAIANGRLNGDLIRFSVGETHYTGRVTGETMEGVYESGGKSGKWTMTKLPKRLQGPP